MPLDNLADKRDEGKAAGFGLHGENLSIMIPNYNGAKYLAETIESVLAQGTRTEQAEVCVLDNCSTDDGEAVTRKAGQDRVRFVRHNENIGAVPNMNACLTRATRLWVHVLHSDDTVLLGGYDEADRVLCENADCNALFGRAVYMDEQSRWWGATALLGDGMRGPLPYDPVLWRTCPVQFVGAFLRRDCIQATGGFRLDLPCATDWNLWWRIAKGQKPAFTNQCVGAYRVADGSGTSRGLKTGALIGDTLQQLRDVAGTMPSGKADAAYGPMFELYLGDMVKLFDEPAAFQTNLRLMNQFPMTPKQKAKLARLQMQFMRYRMRPGGAKKSV